MSDEMLTDLIQIGGAGPAGLAAAITLARAGRRVLVHELQGEVGHRFDGDFQGLENWSAQHDALELLRDVGLSTAFTAKPCSRAEVFDAWGKRYEVEGKKTFFYLVERGPGPGTLDSALLEQARGLGVEVRFNSRLDHLRGAGILAAGPKAADAIAVGYHFETALQDGVWVILDDELAPQGYAYLLVMNGRGTVKSCMFSRFKQEHLYVERTVAAFQRLAGLEMVNPRPHGGVGNFYIPARAVMGVHPVVGEAAGFQDFLWGFGMRYAIHSGVLAARSLLEGKDYDLLWRLELEPQMWNSMVNRSLFGLLGNRGYRWLLQRSQAQHWDVHRALHKLYQPWPVKRLLLPWARTRYSSRRQDESCDHVNCSCVWCRHADHRNADAQKTCGS
ncbi:MAG: NAD(P)-binding protein [Rhodoferax sp.]|nr:NAD(P)-binding protein [Rhodoferax sp.]